ncbi:2-amino-4-hydroxy-6-hydroxymethyldihydropteridinepyrophosphokinase [uncultured Paludibacter sp.]|nr:2-amino-4-hydroxy-6-hydroxymethyldihydropteridinepyrophosphokinase [uncultured Paludibacter sp.]
MPLAYLGIGTNLGDREANLNKAMILLREYVGDIYNISSFYTFKPWGFVSENDFSNAAVLVNTELNPSQLLDALKKIEKEMGRISTTTEIYEDRIIDIDILLYESRIINEQNLIIPHPNMEKREFVLVPLAEIAPDLVHPVTHKTILQMKNELKTN